MENSINHANRIQTETTLNTNTGMYEHLAQRPNNGNTTLTAYDDLNNVIHNGTSLSSESTSQPYVEILPTLGNTFVQRGDAVQDYEQPDAIHVL